MPTQDWDLHKVVHLTCQLHVPTQGVARHHQAELNKESKLQAIAIITEDTTQAVAYMGVQPKPLSSPEVQHGIFKQPMKACLLDSVPDTCKKDYKAITTSFMQGWLYLPNQPMIAVTPSPDQRPGNLMISLQGPLPTATQQHPTSSRQGCSRLTSFCQTTHPSKSFCQMSYTPLSPRQAIRTRPSLFRRMISQPQSFCQKTSLPLSLSRATCSRLLSSVKQGTSGHCSVERCTHSCCSTTFQLSLLCRVRHRLLPFVQEAS